MKITKNINLDNKKYYIIIDTIYKKNDSGYPRLCLKNYKYNYYDGGDLSILIKHLEDRYKLGNVRVYDKDISYMNDIIYIYESIPFISGIGDIYYSDNKEISTYSYITKEEIDEYINNFNIKINYNSKFKLSDSRTWN